MIKDFSYKRRIPRQQCCGDECAVKGGRGKHLFSMWRRAVSETSVENREVLKNEDTSSALLRGASLSIMRRPISILPLLPAVFVFLFFFGVYLFVFTSASEFTVNDDVFYHAAYSVAYLDGTTLNYPIYTTVSQRPVDLWYGFHVVLSWFINGFDGTNFDYVLRNIKLVYSVFVGIYFSVLYLVAFCFSKDFLKLGSKHSMLLGLTTVFFLFGVAPMFDIRMLLVRPHIFSSLLFLLLFGAVAWKRPMLVLLVSAVLPFFYSASFILLIVPMIYCASLLAYRQFKVSWIECLWPLLLTLLGLLVGIILRPDSLNYLYTGYFSIFLVLLNKFLRIVVIPAELNNPDLSSVSLLWYIPLIVSVGFYVLRYVKNQRVADISFPQFFLLFLTISLYAVHLVFSRASEYFFPFLALFVVVTFYEVISIDVNTWLPVYREGGSLLTNLFIRGIQEVRWWFMQYAKIIRTVFITVFMITLSLFSLAVVLGMTRWALNQPPSDRYKDAAAFIERDSNGKGIVFMEFFHQYPSLTFYNSRNQYIMGMDPMFTYLYDPDLYFLWKHIITGERICPKQTCGDLDPKLDAYETIQRQFNAKYIFVDALEKMRSTQKPSPFLKVLEGDTRFRKVYVSPKYPDIMVYKL